MTEVGLAAGFSSVRRFNEAFLAAFGRTPSQLRRAPGEDPGSIALRLGVAPPFDWTGLLDILGSRAIDGIESVSQDQYRRTFQESGNIGTIEVQRLDERTLTVEVCSPNLAALPGVLARVRILFDLGADPAALSERFGQDALWGKQLAANPGLRVAGPWDPFEHVVRTTIDQHVDRAAKSNRLRTFAHRYGKRLDSKAEGLAVVFPEPARIAEEVTADLLPEPSASLAIQSYARAVAEGQLPLTLYDTLEGAVEKLQTLPGFDPMLAQRCATGFLHPTDAIGDADDCETSRYDHWRPWRAYAISLDRENQGVVIVPRERWFKDLLPSPIGDVLLVTDQEGALRALDFADYDERMLRLLRLQNLAVDLSTNHAPEDVCRSVKAYFEGDIHALSSVRWKTGGTTFQRQVWAALASIPPGTTATYSEIAIHIGRPSAIRAVGLANGSNPIAIVVPCHRVIGRNGSLTGYGGGLPRKQWLLRHEGWIGRRDVAVEQSDFGSVW